MKKYFTLLILLVLSINLIAQEKYPVPVRTADQKHARTLSQVWTILAAGINYAKSNGVTPYEYGRYVGKLFAPSWGPGNDFDTYMNGIIYNNEMFRHTSDAELQIKENPDGSVTMIIAENTWHKYLPEGNPFASFGEMLEFMKGLNEPIAEHMGASFKMDVKDALMVFTFKKK